MRLPRCRRPVCCRDSARARRRAQRACAAMAVGAAIHRPIIVDRRRAAFGAEALAGPSRQDRVRVERARHHSIGGALRRSYSVDGVVPCDIGRIFKLHHPAYSTLRGDGRNTGHRQSARHAARQHRRPGVRDRDRQHRRHHWRGHDSGQAAAAGELGAASQCARGRILHLSSRQYRWRAVAARRPAAVRRLFARRRFFLDHDASVAADRIDGGDRACRVRCG